MKKQEVTYVNEDGQQITEKLMVMRKEGGKIRIEEADFPAIHRNMEEIFQWAKQGEEIYEDWVKVFETGTAIDDIIAINRKARTINDCIEKLQEKYNIRHSSAEALVNLSLSALADADLENMKERLAYYSLAVKQLKPLVNFHFNNVLVCP